MDLDIIMSIVLFLVTFGGLVYLGEKYPNGIHRAWVLFLLLTLCASSYFNQRFIEKDTIIKVKNGETDIEITGYTIDSQGDTIEVVYGDVVYLN